MQYYFLWAGLRVPESRRSGWLQCSSHASAAPILTKQLTFGDLGGGRFPELQGRVLEPQWSKRGRHVSLSSSGKSGMCGISSASMGLGKSRHCGTSPGNRMCCWPGAEGSAHSHKVSWWGAVWNWDCCLQGNGKQFCFQGHIWDPGFILQVQSTFDWPVCTGFRANISSQLQTVLGNGYYYLYLPCVEAKAQGGCVYCHRAGML